MAKVKLNELEKAAKEECLFRNLRAYLEACVSVHFHLQNLPGQLEASIWNRNSMF